jgi:hypothetical protein
VRKTLVDTGQRECNRANTDEIRRMADHGLRISFVVFWKRKSCVDGRTTWQVTTERPSVPCDMAHSA